MRLDQVMLNGDESAIPAFGISGRIYFATDSKKVFIDDGSQWIDVTATGGTTLPDGGTTGQALIKQSNADGDADWEDITVEAPAASDFVGPFAGAATTAAGPDVWANVFGGIITRNGTGDYTFTFAVARPDNDYFVDVKAGREYNAGGGNMILAWVIEKTTTFCRFAMGYANNTNYNTEWVNVLFFSSSFAADSSNMIAHVGPIAGLVFNCVTTTIVNSFGLASATRTATGNIQCQLTENQTNIGFFVIGASGRDEAASGANTHLCPFTLMQKVVGPPSTFRIGTMSSNGNTENADHVVLLVFPWNIWLGSIREGTEPFAAFDFNGTTNASNNQIGGTMARTGTGLFTFTFTTPRSNANYYFGACAGMDRADNGSDDLCAVGILERHTNYVKFNVTNGDGSLLNPYNFNGIFYPEDTVAAAAAV